VDVHGAADHAPVPRSHHRGSCLYLSPGGRPPQERGQAPETALDILNKRYARGEIDTAEFEEKRRAITE
jgi:hypothetical protein